MSASAASKNVVRTRFAPSPTGYLHIGGARTALFNFLYAKHHGGQFVLRIEDTDTARNSKEATDAILTSLDWLGIKPDEPPVFQSKNIDRHKQIAQELLKNGKAFYCYTEQAEIDRQRADAEAKKQFFRFHSQWRDIEPDEQQKASLPPPVVRLKAPRGNSNSNTGSNQQDKDENYMITKDLLLGDVKVKHSQLDDMIILRSDGTPTYLLAVVVDDHDMGITHIIRGNEHLNNASRQQMIYEALGWAVPQMAHIPLIHGMDGKKLSKRHGAVGAGAYKDMGYLPEALCNYLLRLGWSHGNDEVISREQAIQWFGIEGLGKSPSCLDESKMRQMNAHYLRLKSADELSEMVYAHYYLKGKDFKLSDKSKQAIRDAMDPCIRPRIELVSDLYDQALMFINFSDLQLGLDSNNNNEIKLDGIDKLTQKGFIPQDEYEKVKELKQQQLTKYPDLFADVSNIIKDRFITETGSVQVLDAASDKLRLTKDNVQKLMKEHASSLGLKIGELMKYMRPAIAGRTASPSVFDMIEILGKKETLVRL